MEVSTPATEETYEAETDDANPATDEVASRLGTVDDDSIGAGMEVTTPATEEDAKAGMDCDPATDEDPITRTEVKTLAVDKASEVGTGVGIPVTDEALISGTDVEILVAEEASVAGIGVDPPTTEDVTPATDEDPVTRTEVRTLAAEEASEVGILVGALDAVTGHTVV